MGQEHLSGLVPTNITMETSLPKEWGIKAKVLPTVWYIWKCPKRPCPRTIKGTVVRYVEVNAIRHLQAHKTRKDKAEKMRDLLKELKGVNA